MQKWSAYLGDRPINLTVDENNILVTIPEAAYNTYLSFELKIDRTKPDDYIFMPACCYDGNRFDVYKKPYPPMLTVEEARVDQPVSITEVPRLNKDGSGIIEVTTGDMSVPCFGILLREQKRAVFVFTEQSLLGDNLGFSYEQSLLRISAPHMRLNGQYRMCTMTDEKDSGMDFEAGQTITLPYRLIDLPCEDMAEFFDIFFTHRKCMGMDDTPPAVPSPEEQWRIHEHKFNTMNYCPVRKLYRVGVVGNTFQYWQPGWVGGAISSYPLMKCGTKESYERGKETLEFLFSTQTKAGFFRSVMDENGDTYSDAFGVPGAHTRHLIRKSADVLYFLFKHYNVMKEHNDSIPEHFIWGTRRIADAIVTLWERYGQLGQFVCEDTGDILIGGSTAGGIAPAGLCKAYEWFGDQRYLNAARQIAEQYYTRDVMSGYTTGGPGEIMQNPDSESAFGLLESLVCLCETDNNPEWIKKACHMAALCSSWVVSYNFVFPPDSEFGRKGMKTCGTVFASTQNKHSAPGICTLSGDSLKRLYEITGDERYLSLITDIARSIGQHLSRPDCPIYSWDNPPERLPDGYICERVNMSDWEGYENVGGVFNGSTWAETSNMLTIAELREIMQ